MQLFTWVYILGGMVLYGQSFVYKHLVHVRPASLINMNHMIIIFVKFNANETVIKHIENNLVKIPKPKMHGYDTRYTNDSRNSTLLHQIANQIKIQKLLKYLENPHKSQYEKLDHLAEELSAITLSANASAILQENLRGANLEAGGLYKEWIFDIDVMPPF